MSEEKKLTLRDLQLANLYLLKEVRDFCNNNDINYVLYCGTLLGCVRHKGFIPWDDDIDIAIPLKDYKRFIKGFPRKEAGGEGSVYIKSPETDLYYGLPWAKVFLGGTRYCSKEEEDVPYDYEISIDIYPILGVFDNKYFNRLQLFLVHLSRALVAGPQEQHLRDIRGDKYRFLHSVMDRIPRWIRVLLYRATTIFTWRDPQKHLHVGTIDGAPFVGKYCWEDWSEYNLGEFEMDMFNIPKEYDKLLHIMYGN